MQPQPVTSQGARGHWSWGELLFPWPAVPIGTIRWLSRSLGGGGSNKAICVSHKKRLQRPPFGKQFPMADFEFCTRKMPLICLLSGWFWLFSLKGPLILMGSPWLLLELGLVLSGNLFLSSRSWLGCPCISKTNEEPTAQLRSAYNCLCLFYARCSSQLCWT